MRLTNTMSLKQEVFKPHNQQEVKMFSCGPSIYRRPHIGNYRTFIYQDTLQKYLEYLGYKIKRLIVFTDIEDKGISEAFKQKRALKELTQEAAAHFFKDVKLLQIKLPATIPNSTSSVYPAVNIIETLIKKNYAYWHQGDVFFDPLKKKDFGKLFGLDMKRWPKKKMRFKRDNYDDNRWNLGDFILWHGYKKGESIYWDTKIGKGRPAWHIQDPAIILKKLGEQVDLNCGGIDNIYRHHDYTIAIMEAISGKPYAQYYLHGEHLYVNGKKMSKSQGNIIYPSDLIEKNYKPTHLRFFLGMTKHYRKKLYFTFDRFKKQASYLDMFNKLASELIKKTKVISQKANGRVDGLIKKVITEFERNMNDDLNVAGAIKSIYQLLLKLDQDRNSLTMSQRRELKQNLKKVNKVLNVL